MVRTQDVDIFICTKDHFTRLFNDDKSFPLRCCLGPISINAIRAFLASEIETEFTAKTKEYRT